MVEKRVSREVMEIELFGERATLLRQILEEFIEDQRGRPTLDTEDFDFLVELEGKLAHFERKQTSTRDLLAILRARTEKLGQMHWGAELGEAVRMMRLEEEIKEIEAEIERRSLGG